MAMRSFIYAVVGFLFLLVVGVAVIQAVRVGSLETTAVEKERDDAKATSDNQSSRARTDQSVKVMPSSTVREGLLEWSL